MTFQPKSLTWGQLLQKSTYFWQQNYWALLYQAFLVSLLHYVLVMASKISSFDPSATIGTLIMMGWLGFSWLWLTMLTWIGQRYQNQPQSLPQSSLNILNVYLPLLGVLLAIALGPLITLAVGFGLFALAQVNAWPQAIAILIITITAMVMLGLIVPKLYAPHWVLLKQADTSVALMRSQQLFKLNFWRTTSRLGIIGLFSASLLLSPMWLNATFASFPLWLHASLQGLANLGLMLMLPWLLSIHMIEFYHLSEAPMAPNAKNA